MRQRGPGLWEPNKPLHEICRCQVCAGRRLAEIVREAFDRPKAPGIRTRMRAALDAFDKASDDASPHR